MPKLPSHLTKWSYDERRQLITAVQRVTNEDVEDVLDGAEDLGAYCYIALFSGVHGAPGGTLQVDDPEFYEIDKKLADPGKDTVAEPRISVFKMPLQEKAPHQLTIRLGQPKILVILAWCYSQGYV